jgi:hypothetical protein
LSQVVIFFIISSSQYLESVGQLLIQALQRMHPSIVVVTRPLMAIAAVGQTVAQV